ncbi:hypothetical protein N0V82_010314 [Gnomoniopsis sp. IMI 355080]|nr:hypothetical protein N0V82_010314 [Gnomoniopsis sp. IMI 355080]
MAVFADLPAELRTQIWELCVQLAVEPGAAADDDYYHQPFVPRVRKRRYPLVTNTCRESRYHLLTPHVAQRHYIGQDHRPLDPDRDIIFLRWPAHMHRMRMVITLAIKYGNPQPWPARVTRLALSQECCADLCNNNENDMMLGGADFERCRLLETLLCPPNRRSHRHALKEVSLVHVGPDVDLEVSDPWVELAEWTPGSRSSTTMVQEERDMVLAMRALLAKELDMVDRAWACHPHHGPVDAAWAPSEERERESELMERTALCVKRMVKPGLVREPSRWKAAALKMRMAGLARWWLRQSQATKKMHAQYPDPPIETAAAEIITALNLTANPEKGYYTQTFVDPLNVTYTAVTANGTSYPTTRAASTAIYYLLQGSEGDSYWHRHDGLEVWHYYAGAPLLLRLSWDDGEPVREVVLGGEVVGGGGGRAEQQRPQRFVGRWEWQSARSLGAWTLVGTTGK